MGDTEWRVPLAPLAAPFLLRLPLVFAAEDGRERMFCKFSSGASGARVFFPCTVVGVFDALIGPATGCCIPMHGMVWGARRTASLFKLCGPRT